MKKVGADGRNEMLCLMRGELVLEKEASKDVCDSMVVTSANVGRYDTSLLSTTRRKKKKKKKLMTMVVVKV